MKFDTIQCKIFSKYSTQFPSENKFWNTQLNQDLNPVTPASWTASRWPKHCTVSYNAMYP